MAGCQLCENLTRQMYLCLTTHSCSRSKSRQQTGRAATAAGRGPRDDAFHLGCWRLEHRRDGQGHGDGGWVWVAAPLVVVTARCEGGSPV